MSHYEAKNLFPVPVIEKQGKFTPSPRQSAIFEAMSQPGNICVQACAGSGKTTTMVWLASQLPPTLKILALSFNKNIADELARRMPGNVKSCTMHSLGFASIRKAVKGVRVDDKKLMNIIDTHPGIVHLPPATRSLVVSDLLSLVPLAQDTMVDCNQLGMLSAMADMAGRTIEEPGQSLPLVASIVAAMDRMKQYISFSEMIRHPVVHSYAVEQFDVVFVDEVQDLNSSQHALLQKIVKAGGKIIAVGDRYQSIYGFRGADPRSMERLKADWKMTELPLDVSYRCGAAIIAAAQAIVGSDTIQPKPGAHAGAVESLAYEKLADDAKEGDMILCRCNAPLVPIALRMLKMGKKAVIRGRDIGAQLSALVRRSRTSDVPALLAYVVKWKSERVTKMVSAKKSDSAKQSVEDTADTHYANAMDFETVAGVLEALSALFSDDRAGVCLSTVHKAKGLEAGTVYIAGPELLPAPWAKSAAEQEQERNIHYVAVTRAMNRLVKVPLPKRRDSEE